MGLILGTGQGRALHGSRKRPGVLVPLHTNPTANGTGEGPAMRHSERQTWEPMVGGGVGKWACKAPPPLNPTFSPPGWR